MKVYRSETQKAIKSFLGGRLGFSDCIASLDAALATLKSRLTGEPIAPLRALILENNNIVMKEMQRRALPPSDPKILAALGDGIAIAD